jgi:hypothetical protein
MEDQKHQKLRQAAGAFNQDQTAENSKADAEELVRKAALAYKEKQSEENRGILRVAVSKLGEWDPPIEEWKPIAPSHLFMLELLPNHLRWPDPFWGDSMFD